MPGIGIRRDGAWLDKALTAQATNWPNAKMVSPQARRIILWCKTPGYRKTRSIPADAHVINRIGAAWGGESNGGCPGIAHLNCR